MSDAGARAVLLSADGIEQGRTQLRAGVLPLADRPAPQFAVLTDPLLSVAATGPRQPSLVGAAAGGAVAASTAAGTSTPLSTQDAIGALAFRARSGPDRSGAPVVLAPPHQWAAEAAGATALLQAVDTLMEAGFLTPRPLDDVLRRPAATAQARTVSYPLRAGGREVVGAVTDAVRATGADIDDLRSAAVPDSGIGLEPGRRTRPAGPRPAAADVGGVPRAAGGGHRRGGAERPADRRPARHGAGAGAAQPVRAGHLGRAAAGDHRQRAAVHRPGPAGDLQHVRAEGGADRRRSRCRRWAGGRPG